MTPVRLFALTSADTAHAGPLPAGTQEVAFRDLAAVVQEVAFVREFATWPIVGPA